MFELTGKGIIVTGGGSGIGAAMARRFRAAGANVLVADISDVGNEVEKWGCQFRKTDVSNPADVAALCDDAVKRFGSLDIMVNNAAIASGHPLAEADEARSLRLWRVNLLGVQMGIKEAAARMKPGSAILNISSITAVIGMPTWGEYAATKGGIIALTQTAAVEFGPAGIRVNCIAPGIINTPLSMKEAPEMVARNAEVFTLVGRIGTPEELAAAAHFLVSDDASYVTGQVLLVDGGWTAGISIKGIEVALSTTA